MTAHWQFISFYTDLLLVMSSHFDKEWFLSSFLLEGLFHLFSWSTRMIFSVLINVAKNQTFEMQWGYIIQAHWLIALHPPFTRWITTSPASSFWNFWSVFAYCVRVVIILVMDMLSAKKNKISNRYRKILVSKALMSVWLDVFLLP